MGILFRIRLIVFLPVFAGLILASIACGSQKTVGTETPTGTLTAAVAASPAEPTPTPAVVPSPTSTTTGEISLEIPNCVTGTGFSDGSSLGTAPAPTPTPLPSGGSRDPELIANELSAYLGEIAPVIAYLEAWNADFSATWSPDLSTGQQKQALATLGTRVSHACDAVARIAEIPPEAAGFDSLVREAARVRHAWVRMAIDQVLCCDGASSAETATGNADTSEIVDGLVAEQVALSGRYGADPVRVITLEDGITGVTLTGDSGWMPSADGLNPVYYAPFELNAPGVDGLGPNRWQHGTAIRIRRLRNAGTTDAEKASTQFSALVTQQGELTSTNPVTLDGIYALRHEVSPDLPEWRTTVTVLVANGFTYFVEAGCPTSVPDACEAVDAVANSIQIVH